MAGQLRKDDVGSIIRVRVIENNKPLDASTATVKTMKLQRPSGSVIEAAATFETDGKDGIIVYQTVEGDLTESGPWTGQVFLQSTGGHWHTEPFNFVVGDNLASPTSASVPTPTRRERAA
jgi:hypothetical protein